MKKLHKMMKAFAVSVALALVFCMIPVGSVYAETNAGTGNGSENGENGGTPSENPETVQVTIDNTNSHVGVRFYQDTNNVEEIEETDTFKWIAPGTNETISVPKDAKARIRVYIQANGYYIPEDSFNNVTVSSYPKISGRFPPTSGDKDNFPSENAPAPANPVVMEHG